MGVIYKITNEINGKIYIGQTKRKFEEREKEHFRDAFREKSSNYNCIFYKAIRKYGKESFVSEILEECPDNCLNEKEIYWIKFYNSNIKGYNMNQGGDQINAKKIDYQKIYEAKMNYHLNAHELATQFQCSVATVQNALKACGMTTKESQKISASKRGKKVFCYNPINNKIQEYISVADASKKTSVHRANINKALKNKIKSAGGFLWGEFLEQLQEKIQKYDFKRPLKHQIKIDKFSLNGIYIDTYNSLKEALASVGKESNSGGITNNLNGRARSAYGYIWKYNIGG